VSWGRGLAGREAGGSGGKVKKKPFQSRNGFNMKEVL